MFFCRRRSLSDQGRYFVVEKDQAKNKVHTDSAVKQDTISKLISPHIQGQNFSSKAESCYNRYEKNIPKIKEEYPFVPVTFAMVSDQAEIQPDNKVQTFNLINPFHIEEELYSPPHNVLGPSPTETQKKTEPERVGRHLSKRVRVYVNNRAHKDDNFITTREEIVRKNYFRQGFEEVIPGGSNTGKTGGTQPSFGARQIRLF